MVSCNLPPALLAEWPGSFTCYCSNMGVEQIPKVDPGEENSPAGIWTRDLSITSLALWPLSYPAPHIYICKFTSSLKGTNHLKTWKWKLEIKKKKEICLFVWFNTMVHLRGTGSMLCYGACLIHHNLVSLVMDNGTGCTQQWWVSQHAHVVHTASWQKAQKVSTKINKPVGNW